MPGNMLSPTMLAVGGFIVLVGLTAYYRLEEGSTDDAIERTGERVESATAGFLSATRALLLSVIAIGFTAGDQLVELLSISAGLIADAPYLISNLFAIVLGAVSTQIGLSGEQYVGIAMAALGIALLTREASEAT